MTPEIQAATRRIASVNPATGEVLREFGCAEENDILAAVARAHAAQPGWAEIGVRRRVDLVREFQRKVQQQKSGIARLIACEAGKPVAEALTTEVLVVLDGARFLIENAYRLLRDEPVPHGNLAAKLKRGRLVREPYGVVGIISPWNYPFSIPATEALAALVAGNAVILKPSEFTSLVALELQSLLHGAGIPRDVFQVLLGESGTGSAFVRSPIDKLIFTGSVNTGKRIAAASAERLLPVVLELGGKDPMLVLEDSDVDVASSAAVWGAFVNAGQTCLSVERCYVHRTLYQPFLKACVEKIKALRVGNGLDPETDIGPLIHERQLAIVESHVEDAIAHGAHVLTGGLRMPQLGKNFYQPTVLADVNHEMRIMREETFGPVLPVMPFDSEDEAIRLANDSEFGLAASVWTRNGARGEQLARRVHAGTVMVNDLISCFAISEAPHGGVKASGLGRAHGRYGLDEMVRMKYVDTDLNAAMKKVWWYGYGAGFARQMAGFIDFQFACNWRERLRGVIRAAGIVKNKKL